jgi:hypothetical protein
MAKIGHNIYIIDFLKYILVRDQKHRPNIENVLKRFEHVHALLVTNSNPPTSSFSPVTPTIFIKKNIIGATLE